MSAAALARLHLERAGIPPALLAKWEALTDALQAYTWIYGGRLQAQQVGKGTPWKIFLDEEKIASLKSHLERIKPSKRKAA